MAQLYSQIVITTNEKQVPGDISPPRTTQVMCMQRKIEDQEDPKVPFQESVPHEIPHTVHLQQKLENK